MPEVSGLFNSLNGDRKYNASWFAEYFSNFLTDGIFNGGTNLQVYTTDSDYIVRVKVGRAWIQGYYYALKDAERQLVPDAADPANDRIDRVVLRLSVAQAARSITAVIKKGIPAGTPAPPDLEQDLTGSGIYELSLAQVLVGTGVTTIASAAVTDERLDNDVCGLVESLIQADTTDIFDQFQAYLDAKTAEFDGIMSDYDTYIQAQVDDWDAWYAANKAAIFDTLYFAFENWRYRAGHTYKTEFDTPSAGDITETIKVTLSGDVVATRVTEFNKPATGQIKETLSITEGSVSVAKVTTFNVDGSIDEVVS